MSHGSMVVYRSSVLAVLHAYVIDVFLALRIASFFSFHNDVPGTSL
jgi:hypothetical protein